MRTALGILAGALTFPLVFVAAWVFFAYFYGGGEQLVVDGALQLDRLVDNVLNTVGAAISGAIIAVLAFKAVAGRLD